MEGSEPEMEISRCGGWRVKVTPAFMRWKGMVCEREWELEFFWWGEEGVIVLE